MGRRRQDAARKPGCAAAGSTYRAAADDFINAQIPFYYSGSWQVANLSSKIGDGFDWVATGSPCGTAGCSGLKGGAALVAIKYTKNPDDVGKVMDYLGREDIVKEFSERTLFLPAHKGVDRQGRPEMGQRWTRMSRLRWTPSSRPQARHCRRPTRCRHGSGPTAYYAALVTRASSQVMAGEMTLDDAWAKIDQDIADKVASRRK